MSTDDVEKTTNEAVKGLKGIIAADSSICLVNGTEGKLLYRGYNIDELAEHATFEEVSFLLLNGELPTPSQLTEYQDNLKQYRAIEPELIEALKKLPTEALPMALLRTITSMAGVYDPDAESESFEKRLQISMRLISQIPTIVAAIHRVRKGLEPVAPDLSLSHAGNFMYMLNGEKPSEDATRAMDLILTLHAEHGLNASTFTGRVVIATLPDIYSAVTAAIGALKGKLHGGANTEVLKTLFEIGSVENIAPYVKKVREAKGKFMGFGHAVYQVEDPRAKHLKELSRRLGEETGNPKWYEMSVEMEKLVFAEISRNCNVDFYSASLQHYMGIPGELFTCIFAASRIAGWCAHILEQLDGNKIIRPKAHYIGYEERAYVSIGQR
ncbi:MAG: citrate synthase [Planctomycetes bacterium]|nr:citrate synthase [Planctomycetota bacterium]MCH9723850.1 citrate synthase [Planctomycetota bacterium]MCH9778049.1 citrate synthase [Planctomycetota bacterium]MCH9789627.1 citrate synthase [Planctomycetota bacterium]MDF1742803.1 citrate synthase [Gimesia sp.]